MGGDHGGGHAGGDFRQKVWSMTGGPYCRPVHWRRNTAIAMFGVFLICIPIAMKSAELEVRMRPPCAEALTHANPLRGVQGLKDLSNARITQSGQSHRNCGAKTLARRSTEELATSMERWHLSFACSAIKLEEVL
ncbi:hypothetical protein U9M48_015168 [Paspalum notatum var. saurae]